ncbi:hypothetical protein BASA81_017223 [Batrachochytrium salamandrivorans]|nr:hypothetical protein BASA81_017223 [Batrachochytrium salamandrivorans]
MLSGQQEKPFRLAISRHLTHSQLIDCILCDQAVLSHPLLISWWSVKQSLAIAFSLDSTRQFRNPDSDCWVAHSIRVVRNVYTWLRGGVLNGEADSGQRWLDGTVEQNLWGRGMISGAGSTVS